MGIFSKRDIIMNPRIYSDILPALRREDYEQTFSEIRELLIQQPQVQSISQFGSVGDPGISDLDLLATVSGNAEHLRSIFLKWVSEHPLRSFIFFHQPLWLPVELVDSLGYFHSAPEPTPQPSTQVSTRDRVWASAVIAISARILIEKQPVSARAVLMLYKNMLESCVRLKHTSAESAAAKNAEMRKDVRHHQIQNGINTPAPDTISERLYSATVDLAHALAMASTEVEPLRPCLIHPFPGLTIRQGDSTIVTRKSTLITIQIKGNVIEDLLADKDYSAAESSARRAFRKCGLPYPFYHRFCINPSLPQVLHTPLMYLKGIFRPAKPWLHNPEQTQKQDRATS